MSEPTQLGMTYPVGASLGIGWKDERGIALLSPKFWSKVAVGDPSNCWIWARGEGREGLRALLHGGRLTEPAHRFAYLSVRSRIPKGLELDRLCRNPICVNPEHLEPVTGRENTLRGEGPATVSARKTRTRASGLDTAAAGIRRRFGRS